MYDYDLVGKLRQLWLERPGLGVDACSQVIGVERHTLTRAARRADTTLLQLKYECLYLAYGRERSRTAPLIKKEIAERLGFPTQGALHQALRRANRRAR